jgi:hypothetical protein
MSKPRVSEVKAWYPMKEDSNDSAALYYADIDNAFIMVQPLKQGYKKKYFYGECAWMDARRYAGDIYTKWIHSHG